MQRAQSRVLVKGNIGSGKTITIENVEDLVAITTPTGTAAIHLDCKSIHIITTYSNSNGFLILFTQAKYIIFNSSWIKITFSI